MLLARPDAVFRRVNQYDLELSEFCNRACRVHRVRARPLRELGAVLAEHNFDIVHIQTAFVAHDLGLRLAGELGLPPVRRKQ